MQMRTYFRHQASGCSGSLSAGPSEATSAKGQASSIRKAASSSLTGKSVSVMTATCGDRGRHLEATPLESPQGAPCGESSSGGLWAGHCPLCAPS